jgi:hypothetical protein
MNHDFRYLFLGASPQTPWVGFAEFWVANLLRSSRLYTLDGLASWVSSQNPRVGFAELWVKIVAQNNFFCFLFWKKKNANRLIGFLWIRPLRLGRLFKVWLWWPSVKHVSSSKTSWLELVKLTCEQAYQKIIIDISFSWWKDPAARYFNFNVGRCDRLMANASITRPRPARYNSYILTYVNCTYIYTYTLIKYNIDRSTYSKNRQLNCMAP